MGKKEKESNPQEAQTEMLKLLVGKTLKKHGVNNDKKNNLSKSDKTQLKETIQSLQKQTEELLKSLQTTVGDNNQATLASLPVENKVADITKKVQDQVSDMKASKEDTVPAKGNIEEKSNVLKGTKIIRRRKK